MGAIIRNYIFNHERVKWLIREAVSKISLLLWNGITVYVQLKKLALTFSISIKIIIYCVRRHSFISNLVALPAESVRCNFIHNSTLMRSSNWSISFSFWFGLRDLSPTCSPVPLSTYTQPPPCPRKHTHQNYWSALFLWVHLVIFTHHMSVLAVPSSVCNSFTVPHLTNASWLLMFR